jgi:stress response protein YsnF
MANEGNVNENYRVVELRGSGFEIAKGEPDIRGWEVKDGQGRIFGKVKELLFDKESLKVRYLVVDLKSNVLNLSSRKVLIPVGLAVLHEDHDDVVLPEITAIHLTELPEYKKTPITYDEELAVRNIFSGTATTGYNREGDTFYKHEHFDENRLYQRRPGAATSSKTIPVIEENLQVGTKDVDTGETKIHTSISEHPVEEDIKLRSENVNIERNEINRPATQEDLRSFEEGTIEFTEKKEIPVVTKEAKVVEEISLNKEITENEATIRDTVRKTDVEIEKNKLNEDPEKGHG